MWMTRSGSTCVGRIRGMLGKCTRCVRRRFGRLGRGRLVSGLGIRRGSLLRRRLRRLRAGRKIRKRKLRKLGLRVLNPSKWGHKNEYCKRCTELVDIFYDY